MPRPAAVKEVKSAVVSWRKFVNVWQWVTDRQTDRQRHRQTETISTNEPTSTRLRNNIKMGKCSPNNINIATKDHKSLPDLKKEIKSK